MLWVQIKIIELYNLDNPDGFYVIKYVIKKSSLKKINNGTVLWTQMKKLELYHFRKEMTTPAEDRTHRIL